MALGTISSGLERFGAALGGQLSQYDDVVNRGEQAKASNALAGQQMAQNAEKFDMQREQLGMKRDMMQQEQEAALSQERKMAGIEDSFKIKTFLDGGNVDHAIKLLENRISNIMELGGDPSDSLETLSNLKQGNIDEVYADVDAVVKAAAANKLIELPGIEGGSHAPAEVRSFQALTEGMSPEQIENAKLIKLGLRPRAAQPTPSIAQEVSRALQVNAAVEQGKTLGKGEGGRKQEFIDQGLVAAQGIPLVRRNLQLLESVKTGGFEALAAKAKQAFGITGPNEAELIANMGRSVLKQLKPTFGAAFTEKEGRALAAIEAGFGKSTPGNKRLMKQMLNIFENSAKRGLRAGPDELTASEIGGFLDGEFDITDESIEGVQTNPSSGSVGIKAISIR